MKTKIINLVGPSGAGKTPISKELHKAGYNVIQSYTTRKPRVKDEWGHTFIEDGFVSHGNYYEYPIDEYKPREFKNMIAYFNSYDSGHHYFATDDQVIRGKTNIYVVDPLGAEQVKEYYKDTDIEVVTVFIYADADTRYERMIKERGFEAVKSRILKDNSIFNTVKTDYFINNNSTLEKGVEQVISLIM